MNIPKLVRELSRRKGRDERDMVVAEGHRLVTDVLQSGAGVVAILAADDVAQDSLFDTARKHNAEIAVVPRKEFDELADTETPSGVLAIVKWTPAALDAMPSSGGRVRALVIDGVQDPGNVGTMIRCALALGAACTIALDGTADLRNPKVIRSAMGALFRHPVAQTSWSELRDRWGVAAPMILLAVKDGPGIRSLPADLRDMAVVIGSEGHGVRADWQDWPSETRRVTIPMQPGAESLNAAVAAGIILYELSRGA
jgi:TrmH family RNA methyltransferase